jgi:hypothetical protein
MFKEQDETKRNGNATGGSASSRKTSFKREIDAPDYDALKDLKACRREYEENEKGYYATRYELLQRGAHDAKLIRRNDELWEKFENDPFWIKSYNGGKPRPQKLKRDKKSALRYALIFMLRARTEEAKQLARKYTRSVARHLKDGVKIADLAATMRLPGNGIEESSRADKGKAKAVSKKTTRKQASKDHRKDVDWDDPIDIVERGKGDDRLGKKATCPITKWDKKAKKAAKKHKFAAGVLLNCDVIDVTNGRMCLKVVGVTERK